MIKFPLKILVYFEIPFGKINHIFTRNEISSDLAKELNDGTLRGT